MLQLGSWELRWYGALFAVSFLLGQQIGRYMWSQEGKNLAYLDVAMVYVFLGTMIGARLGHVLFYDFAYFSQHPLEIFLPFTFEPTFKFTGYQGLASHGAAIGLLIAVYIYVNYVIDLRLWPPKLTIKKQRREGQSYLWFMDRLVIVGILAGCFIRIGNFMNSEIIGKPTHSRYGVLFARDVTQQLQASSRAIQKVTITKSKALLPNDDNYQPVTLAIAFKHGSFEETAIRNFLENDVKRSLVKEPHISRHLAEKQDQPLHYELSKNKRGAYVAHINTLGIVRHPAQLYEAFSSLVLFFLLFYRWSTQKGLLRPGEMIGLFGIIVFGLRIFYEVFKESKVVWAGSWGIPRVPQLLSFPLIVAGILLFIYSRKSSKVQD
ncbi:MAG: prolipoprotein diacylglyceryl transferase [Bacteroidota bacterium]